MSCHTSCATQQDYKNGWVFFGPGWEAPTSHQFEVGADPIIMTVSGLEQGQCVRFESVFGCGAGDEFVTYTRGCCPVSLCGAGATVMITDSGRYRMVLIGGAENDPEAVTVFGRPQKVAPGYGENTMSCCGCGPTTDWTVNTGGTIVGGTFTNPTISGGTITGSTLVGVQLGKDCSGAPITAGASLATCADLAAIVLPTTLPPSGPAGGDLTGSYPNPTFRAGAPVLESCAGVVIRVGDTVVTCADLSAAVATRQSVLVDCAGALIPANTQIPTCAQMTAAIAAANPTAAQVSVSPAVAGASNVQAALTALASRTTGPLADPRPNVNPTYRVVGTDTATGTGYTFAVAQQSDIFGVGIAGQDSGPPKLLTVDSMSNLTRTDETNNIYGTGAYAASNSTGNGVSATGFAAGAYNTGSAVAFDGYQAGYKNAGSYISANGYLSAAYNTGDYINSFGYSAAHNNTGSYVSALGYASCFDNTGSSVFAAGSNSASYNSGSTISAAGYNVAHKNVGSNVDTFGHYAAAANTGNHAVLIGEYAGTHNRGDYVCHVGNTCGYYPLIVDEPGLTITQASPTTVSLSSPTAAAVGSTVVLYGGYGSIAYLNDTYTPMVVTSPTVLAVLAGAGTLNRALNAGVNTGASVRQAPAWNNVATFGNHSQATGPNQAVLGGPSQTPCGWAPFLVISDERDKIFLRDEMKSGKAAKGAAPAFELTPEIALDFVSRQLPGAFRYDHRERYNTVVEVAVEVAETEAETKAERKAERKAGGAVGEPAFSNAVREKATRFHAVAEKQDGSRADDHYTIGYSAQQLLEAAKAAGIPPEFSGVRDMNEHGNDKLLLDAQANVAFLTLAVQALLVRIQKLEGGI